MGRRPNPIEPGPEFHFAPYPEGTRFVHAGYIHEVLFFDLGTSAASTFIRCLKHDHGRTEKVIFRLSEIMASIEAARQQAKRINEALASTGKKGEKGAKLISQTVLLQKSILAAMPASPLGSRIVDILDVVIDELKKVETPTK